MYLLIFALLLIALYFFLSWDKYAGTSKMDEAIIEEQIRQANAAIRGRALGRVPVAPPHVPDIEYENEMFGDEED